MLIGNHRKIAFGEFFPQRSTISDQKSRINNEKTEYSREPGGHRLSPSSERTQRLASHHQSVWRRSGELCCLRGFARVEIDRPHRDSGIPFATLRKRTGKDCGGAV